MPLPSRRLYCVSRPHHNKTAKPNNSHFHRPRVQRNAHRTLERVDSLGRTMVSFSKFSRMVLLLFALPLSLAPTSASQSKAIGKQSTRARAANVLVTLGTQIKRTTLDCSHFVNSLFEQVGFHYDYEPSIVLYGGTTAFKRVYKPVAGDLVVWPGHVGIVVDPNQQTFVSSLNSGVKVASYASSYWRRRGHARFFRYRLPVAESTPTWEASLFQSVPPSINSGLE